MEAQENLNVLDEEAYFYTDEEYQTMLQKNKYAATYSVTLDFDQTTVNTPPYCTCCLKKTDQTLTAIQSNERYRRTGITVSLDLPFCADCMAHYYHALIQERKLFYLPLLSLVPFTILLSLGFNIYASPLILIAVHLILFILLGKLLKTMPLEREHSHLEASVIIRPLKRDLETVTFVFTNWLYAKLFAKANNAELLQNTARDVVPNNSILSNSINPVHLYIGSIAATLGAGLVIWLIFFCTAH